MPLPMFDTKDRSTPAHAGNTFALALVQPIALVYPRPRGEYPHAEDAPHALHGLPPPTRGIRLSHSLYRRLHRSTPAHAGNTLYHKGYRLALTVYPRPRGEYFVVSSSTLDR